MSEWIDVPTEQGWWWHWDKDNREGYAPYLYSILASLTGGVKRYFIAYPDSRWCDDVGGKWMKVVQPASPEIEAVHEAKTA